MIMGTKYIWILYTWVTQCGEYIWRHIYVTLSRFRWVTVWPYLGKNSPLWLIFYIPWQLLRVWWDLVKFLKIFDLYLELALDTFWNWYFDKILWPNAAIFINGQTLRKYYSHLVTLVIAIGDSQTSFSVFLSGSLTPNKISSLTYL